MNITRDGAKLKFDAQSGIGYYLTFTHECGSEGNAEAWLRHIKAYYDKQAEYARNRESAKDDEIANLQHRVRNLKRSVRRHKKKARELQSLD